jgi:hypothetical protein
MSTFNKKAKEIKQQEKLEKFTEKYQLDGISDKDIEILKIITSDLTDNGSFKAGLSLSVLIEQNWLIFRKLDEISKKLDK